MFPTPGIFTPPLAAADDTHALFRSSERSAVPETEPSPDGRLTDAVPVPADQGPIDRDTMPTMQDDRRSREAAEAGGGME